MFRLLLVSASEALRASLLMTLPETNTFESYFVTTACRNAITGRDWLVESLEPKRTSEVCRGGEPLADGPRSRWHEAQVQQTAIFLFTPRRDSLKGTTLPRIASDSLPSN